MNLNLLTVVSFMLGRTIIKDLEHSVWFVIMTPKNTFDQVYSNLSHTNERITLTFVTYLPIGAWVLTEEVF